jgi:hypothetical protein
LGFRLLWLAVVGVERQEGAQAASDKRGNREQQLKEAGLADPKPLVQKLNSMS